MKNDDTTHRSKCVAIIQNFSLYMESPGRGNLLQSPNKFTYCRNLMFFPAYMSDNPEQ